VLEIGSILLELQVFFITKLQILEEILSFFGLIFSPQKTTSFQQDIHNKKPILGMECG